MKITKRQLQKIIKEAATREDIREWFLSKEKENRLDKVLAGMKASDEEREKIMSALAGEDSGKEEKSESIRITKRQLRRIIREEMEKSVPFGSGLEPVEDLDPDQKDIVGHT